MLAFSLPTKDSTQVAMVLVNECQQNSVRELSYYDYGPRSDFKINTFEEFHVKLQFGDSDTLFQ